MLVMCPARLGVVPCSVWVCSNPRTVLKAQLVPPVDLCLAHVRLWSCLEKGQFHASFPHRV